MSDQSHRTLRACFGRLFATIAGVRTASSLAYGAILCIADRAGLPYTQLKTTMEKREQLLLDYDSYKRKVSTHAT